LKIEDGSMLVISSVAKAGSDWLNLAVRPFSRCNNISRWYFSLGIQLSNLRSTSRGPRAETLPNFDGSEDVSAPSRADDQGSVIAWDVSSRRHSINPVHQL
jgi:hypothetical protein